MNIRATLIAISILSAAPAFAEGSVIIFQNGPINWSAVNQYTNHNSVNLNQGGYEGGTRTTMRLSPRPVASMFWPAVRAVPKIR